MFLRSWHWEDAPSMSPTDGFARGAVSLGAEVRQWMSWIVGNVTQAHPQAPVITAPVVSVDED